MVVPKIDLIKKFNFQIGWRELEEAIGREGVKTGTDM